VYALTATPGATPQQFIDTLNIVRPVGVGPFHISNWNRTQNLHHFISFADLSGNAALFAKRKDRTITTPIAPEHHAIILKFLGEYRHKMVVPAPNDAANGKRSKKPIGLIAGDGEYINANTNTNANNAKNGKKKNAEKKALIKAWKELHYEPYTEKQYLKRSKSLQSYFTVTNATPVFGVKATDVFNRISHNYYNFCNPWFSGGQKTKYRDIFKGGRLVLEIGEHEYCISPKLMRVVHNACEGKGKQFVYTSDLKTMRIIATLFEKMYEMTDITKKVVDGVVDNEELCKQLAKQKGLGGRHKNFITMKSAANIVRLQNFMNGIDFEHDKPQEVTPKRLLRNAHGQNCKIILTTGEMFTGLDLNALRGVHIVEPFVSMSSHQQAVGRAVRAGGHIFLPVANRNATVYSYHTRVSLPPEETEGTKKTAGTKKTEGTKKTAGTKKNAGTKMNAGTKKRKREENGVPVQKPVPPANSPYNKYDPEYKYSYNGISSLKVAGLKKMIKQINEHAKKHGGPLIPGLDGLGKEQLIELLCEYLRVKSPGVNRFNKWTLPHGYSYGQLMKKLQEIKSSTKKINHVAQGHQFLNGVARGTVLNKSSGNKGAIRVGNSNHMNTNKNLFSTPDDVLHLERERGQFTNKMKSITNQLKKVSKNKNSANSAS
jgi:hypothetical protein